MIAQPDTDQANGWDGWEIYFVRVYGPHWRDRRCGHNGYKCAYCRGMIRTKESDRLSALNTNPDWPGKDESHEQGTLF